MANNDFLLAQIAKLYYVDKIKQNEIALRFNVTPMMISRYLKKAEQRGIVTIHIKSPWTQDMELGRAVREKYRLMECVALETPANANIPTYLGNFFADYFLTLMAENMIIGVSWGKTIAEFASALPFSTFSNCSVLQMNGAIWMNDQDLMPTRIVQQMGQKLNARTYPMNSPLYVDTPTVWEQLIHDPSNRAVLDLAKRADIVIYGASSLKRESTTMCHNPLMKDSFDELRAAGAIGDVAGIFVDKAGEPVSWSKSGLYMGIPLDDIIMAKNAICLAGETDKAPVLRAAARKGYFKTLITTKETAQAMIDYD